MDTWNIILWSQAPVLFIALWIYFKDKYEKEPWTLLISCYFMGIMSAVLAGFSNTFFFNVFEVKFGEDYLKLFLVAIFVVGLFEEGFKFLFLKKYIYKNENFNEPFDGIIYGAFIGLGFASIENFDYVSKGGKAVAIARMFTAVPMHASLGMILGYFLGNAKFPSSEKTNEILTIIKGFCLVVILHGLYDYFLFIRTGNLLTYLTLVVLIICFILSRKAIKSHQNKSPFKP